MRSTPARTQFARVALASLLAALALAALTAAPASACRDRQLGSAAGPQAPTIEMAGFPAPMKMHGFSGAPSDLHPTERAPVPPRSDHVLFVLLAVGLGFIWTRYRSESDPDGKIRLAALAALVSVVFLSLTAAMPWLSLLGETAEAPVRCLLGQEGACVYRAGSALVAAESGHGPLAALSGEVQRWQCASAALRMGQVTALALLLPALIWLLVDPQHRAAQAAAAVGASVSGFTLLVTLLYRHSVPGWLEAELYWTADLALVTSATIVVAAVLIVRQSFQLICQGHRLPRAIARRR